MSVVNEHKIVIVDDHLLFASSLEKLIHTFVGFKVLYKAGNGAELQEHFELNKPKPDVILLDVNMPVMNGLETISWLSEAHPNIKVLVLSMEDDEEQILKMIRSGAKGYLLKDIDPENLKHALNEVLEKGFYYTEKINEILLDIVQGKGKPDQKSLLKENEITFLKLACTEKTYKEIADIMCLSPKTIDGYRQELFSKLNIKNRVGLVLYAIKNNFVDV
ncbi:MAG: response regulator transcription factor [Flavobacteriaceae bacterium]|nr:response regulator transcription factor [Flavobacteriaceae bacterium]